MFDDLLCVPQLGPDYLVAPVVRQGATSRHMYFPTALESAIGAAATRNTRWVSIWNASDVVHGGVGKEVAAPIDIIPVYRRA